MRDRKSNMEDKTHYPNVPNFRVIPSTVLFRSSRLDDITEEEVEHLKALGIKSILDLRSPNSWEDHLVEDKDTKTPPLDKHYPRAIVSDKRGQLTYRDLPSNCDDVNETEIYGRRLYVDLIGYGFAVGVLRETSWWKQVVCLGLGLAYFTVGTKLIQKKVTQWGLVREGETMILSQNKAMLNHCGKQIATVLHLLSQPENLPAVVQCSHGKDRTGLMSAVLHALCSDKTEDDVLPELVVEYTKTQEWLSALYDHMAGYQESVGLDDTFQTANAETMEHVLAFIKEKHGSIRGYLTSIGFDTEQQEKLKTLISTTPTNSME